MAQSKKKNRILTVIIVLVALILSLGLISRLVGGFGAKSEITVTYNGKAYKKAAAGLVIESYAEFDVKQRDGKADYEVKIYAAGTEASDFTFTVGDAEYSWYRDIAGANGGKGEDFTEVFEVTKTETGFMISGGIEKALTDVWQDKEIGLPENIPAGDRFRMEITSGKTTLTLGFSFKEEGTVGGQKIELFPNEIVF